MAEVDVALVAIEFPDGREDLERGELPRLILDRAHEWRRRELEDLGWYRRLEAIDA